MTTQPNIVLIIADQLVAELTGAYGHPVVRTPNLDRLAARGVRFDAAYCPVPVCSPSRSSMLSGRYASTNSAWDNAAPVASDIPMLPHYLATAGYETALSGKMHFVGADQLHGYEKRLTTDMFPSTLAWTPDRDRVGRFVHPGNPDGPPIAIDYVSSGPVQWTDQLQFDEETHYRALEYLRGKRTRMQGSLQVPSPEPDTDPWFLTVSYHHPHEPFLAPQEYWDRYEDEPIDPVRVRHSADLPHTVMDDWVDRLHGVDQPGVDLDDTEQEYRTRRAYYALVTYIDDKVGELLDVLEQTGHGEDTVVVFTSDHGDMLGERGMVQKRTFYEWSARVPLIVAGGPVAASGTVETTPVSLVDLAPTLCELVGVETVRADGRSFLDALGGGEIGSEPVFVEYHSEGVYAPCWMRREGDLKYVYIHGHDEQLFDVAADPDELHDLSDDPRYADAVARAREHLLSTFDPDDIERRIRESVADRRVVRKAMSATGEMWTYDPHPGLFTQYWRET